MSGTIHVFDFINSSKPIELGSICPLFGGERFLQQLAVDKIKSSNGEEADFSVTVLDGTSCEWSDVQDGLSTRSLFGGGGDQIVVVDQADAFVKQNRERLEKRLEANGHGSLVLIVETWASNTKLYKKIDKSGTQIHCDAPIIKRGRGKQRDDAKIYKWLIARATTKYEFKLPDACATVLVDLTECNFGQMDQELAKISLYADNEKSFTPQEIRSIVGGWPAQTMWTAIDAALEGRAGHALNLLHQLFAAGEHPLAMFGQISWSLRRYAHVGELVTRDSRNRRRINMNDSLKAAGFRTWGNELDIASQRLKQLGRKRVGKILDQLVATDFALKRSHSREERGRLMLELLFTSMSEELSSAR